MEPMHSPNDETTFWKRVDAAIDAGEDPLDDLFVRGSLESMPHLLEPFAEDIARWRTLRSRPGTPTRHSAPTQLSAANQEIETSQIASTKQREIPPQPTAARASRPSHLLRVHTIAAVSALIAATVLVYSNLLQDEAHEPTTRDAGVLALPTFSDTAVVRALSVTQVHITHEHGGSHAEVVVDGNCVRSRLEVTNHSQGPTATSPSVHGAVAILTTTLFVLENH